MTWVRPQDKMRNKLIAALLALTASAGVAAAVLQPADPSAASS